MLARISAVGRRAAVSGRMTVSSARSVHVSAWAGAAGKIKWFNAAKGYGFISREGDADIFVHHTAVQAEGFKILNEGDEVEFEVTTNNDKPSASNVKVLKTSVTQEQRDAFAERSAARREFAQQREEGGFRPRGRGGFRGGRGRGGRGGFRGDRPPRQEQQGEQSQQ